MVATYRERLQRTSAARGTAMWRPPAKHFNGLADDLGIRLSTVIQPAKELADRIGMSLLLVVEDDRQQLDESPVLQRLPIMIHNLVRRVRAQLK